MAQEGAEAPWGSLRGLAQELGRGRCSTFPWAPGDGNALSRLWPPTLCRRKGPSFKKA